MIEEKTQTHHMSDCTVRGLFCMAKNNSCHTLVIPSNTNTATSLPKKKMVNVVATKNPTYNEIYLLI